MNYLISSYQQTVLDKGFAEMSSEFHNEKSIFEERLVVQKRQKTTRSNRFKRKHNNRTKIRRNNIYTRNRRLLCKKQRKSRNNL